MASRITWQLIPSRLITKDEVVMNEQQMGQGGQQQQEPISITLGDLSTLLQMIDVVSTRGGFQGDEMAGVGMLRNKIEGYLQQNAPQQDQSAAEQEVGVEAPAEGSLADKLVG